MEKGLLRLSKKILFITPHLSTGGLPKYLQKKIEILYSNFDTYVIEYKCLSREYVIQRDKIIDFLEDRFFELPSDKHMKLIEIKNIVDKIRPGIIHIEEIPEMFMDDNVSDFIYQNDRQYSIVETSHTVWYDVNNKKYFPDKFVLVSPYQIKQYEKLNIPIDRIDYPVEHPHSTKRISQLKNWNRELLNLSKIDHHISIIGLFSPWKNQAYAFEIAKKLPNVTFHFIGNRAPNLKYYWEPLMKNKPNNCIIWGEQDQVERFYFISDAILFPSYKEDGLAECNPLVIKEGLSYYKDIFMFDQKSYMGEYDHIKNVYYLSGDVDRDSQMILNSLNNKTLPNKRDVFTKFKNLYQNIEKSEYEKNDYKQTGEIINISFINTPKIVIQGPRTNDKYTITFIDKRDNSILMKDTIQTNHWVKYLKEYVIPYKIDISKNGKLIYSTEFNPTNRKVFITLESKSLGDTIAWFPYVEEFRKKWNCELICSTFWNELFEKEYPEIKFVKPGSPVDKLYAMYKIGVYPNKPNKNKNDYRSIPLQQIASDFLDLEFQELRPKITIPKEFYSNEKSYITISKHSTARAKYWNNPTGWQELVDYLKNLDYDVISVAKEGCDIESVIEIKNQPIFEVIKIINGSEFFIGLPSGLAWLAWALGKKVIMISGFSKPWYEFTEDNYYIQNDDFDICTGCFVDENLTFDRGDWNWCPRHKGTERQFECTTTISSNDVIKTIESNNLLIDNKIDWGIITTPRDRHVLTREFKHYKIYDKYFRPNKNNIVVDMGSCIGMYPLFSLRSVDIKQCYCIEPNPKNITALENNISLLDDSEKYKIIKSAINDDITDVGFISFDSNWTPNIKNVENSGDIKIKTIGFKEFINIYNIEIIDILKMDIEGSEFSIFSKDDNLEIIKNKVKNIVAEIHFNFVNEHQRNTFVNKLRLLKNNFDIILTSVDGVDITDNIFNNKFLSAHKKYSYDYYRQFLLYCFNNKNLNNNNILIVGTPRSGTFFTFNILTQLFGCAEHEAYSNKVDKHNVVAWEMAFDNWTGNAIWGEDPENLVQSVSYKDFNKVLHQVRHPLDTISSLLMLDDWFWIKVSEKVNIDFNKDDRLTMAMVVWYEWNKQCEKIAEKTYRIEYITEHLGVFSSIIEIDKVADKNKVKKYNTKEEGFFSLPNGEKYKKLYKKLLWTDLEKHDKELTHKIKEMAKKYGYNE